MIYYIKYLLNLGNPLMKNLSIKTKLLLIVFCSITIISVVLAVESILSMKSTSKDRIESYRTDAYKSKELELKNYVSLAYKTIESYHARTALNLK